MRRGAAARRLALLLVVAGGTSMVMSMVPAPASAEPLRQAQASPSRPAPEPAPAGTPEILGAPAAFSSGDLAERRVRVAEGSAVHELPDARSAAVAVVDAPSELPLVERRGAWVLVRYGAFKGWVLLARVEAGPGAVVPLPARAADPEILARAFAALPGDDAGRDLGPYTLYTDVDDPGLLGRLAAVASGLEATYRRRYGLDPGSAAGQAVVLFAREADYRAFASGDLTYAGLGEGGHAGFGVAALFAQGSQGWQVTALLVHELTHLMNGRSDSRVDDEGSLVPGTLGGVREVSGVERTRTEDGDVLQTTVTTEGAYAALDRLTRRLDQGQLPPLATLTGLSWREIVAPGLREAAYAESAFFIRYLLDGGDEALSRGFRRYLGAIAAGGDGGPDSLQTSLGRDWPELDRGFGRWLRSLELRAGD